ncbi:hypothetical protein, partial [Siminovitchia fortis]|uniref:hypothetical protein n=1 Tax=Siminovitchia fortis TaxID=254758 RepID=UPI001C931010
MQYYNIYIEYMFGGRVNMAKKGPRYVVELFLKTEIFQVHILEKRFEIGRHIYNACKRKMLDNIQQ